MQWLNFRSKCATCNCLSLQAASAMSGIHDSGSGLRLAGSRTEGGLHTVSHSSYKIFKQQKAAIFPRIFCFY